MLIPMSFGEVGLIEKTSTFRKAVFSYNISRKALVCMTKVERATTFDIVFQLAAEVVNRGLYHWLQRVNLLFGKERKDGHSPLPVDIVLDGPN